VSYGIKKSKPDNDHAAIAATFLGIANRKKTQNNSLMKVE
jgi:hypothetical protein